MSESRLLVLVDTYLDTRCRDFHINKVGKAYGPNPSFRIFSIYGCCRDGIVEFWFSVLTMRDMRALFRKRRSWIDQEFIP